MNKLLIRYAREQIKEGLAKLPDGWVYTFKRLYSANNLSLPIDDVIKNMPNEQLSWALTQVQNSLKKRKAFERNLKSEV